MSYDITNIINVNVSITSTGLGFANFASAVLFAPEADTSLLPNTFKSYSSISELSVDFAVGTESNAAASIWLGGIPASNLLTVWVVDATDATTRVTLTNARNSLWWYWSFFTNTVYDELSPYTNILDVASWHDENTSYFQNAQFLAANVSKIRDEGDTTDVATLLTTQGTRHASTFASAATEYAGIALTKWFAAVNYQAVNSTITGEFKKLSGINAESLPTTAYNAMTQDTKKAQFYAVVDLQGSTDNGRVINSFSHSTFNEWMDGIVDLDAFVNTLRVNLYNVLTGQTAKLPYTPAGQATLIGETKATCEQYIANGYLGPRNYIDPDDGVNKFTVGYEVLTEPEAILDQSAADRTARKAAPISVRIFRAGAIQVVDVQVDVF